MMIATSGFLVFAAAFAIAATTSPTVHALSVDVHNSTVKVYVFKTGIFSFAADNHVVDAPLLSGTFDPIKRSIALMIDAKAMRVLDPSMPADRRAKVQANMVGTDVLDVEKYPKISFQSTNTTDADAQTWTVTGDLTLHGQTHPVEISVTKIDATHYHGAAVVRQSRFGITPIRIAGGTVRVKDDLKIVFEIVLR